MVALASRFALLAAVCAAAVVSSTPLIASGATVEARHSDKVGALGGSAGQEKHTKQPVIPLPQKSGKTSSKGSGKAASVERGRIYKGKGRERERSAGWSPADPSTRLNQFPLKFMRSLKQRYHDNDCPRKIIVNGDRDHIHLSCHHDHHHDDHHHDDYDEVIVNGDRDHVRTRRRELQSRTPRHSRPQLQRRNDTAEPLSSMKSVPGVVRVMGTDTPNGQEKSYGDFLVGDRGNGYDVGVSLTNHTIFYMRNATSASGTNSSLVPVFLQAQLPNRTEVRCCSYDPNPSGPVPMTMEPCRDDGDQYAHSSQVFLFDIAVGSVETRWVESGNATVSGTSPNPTSSPQTSGNNTQSGDKNVKMFWRPLAQDGSARVEPGVETRTVTVTVTAGPETKSVGATSAVLREASTSVADSTPTPAPASSTFAIASTLSGQAATKNSTPASSAPDLASTSSIPSSVSPTQDGLKIEVAPNQTTASDSMIPSSSTMIDPSSTASSNVALGVPARDGEVMGTVA